MQNHYYSSQSNPCPICGGHKGCKIGPTTIQCYRAEPTDEPEEEGWFFMKYLSNDMGTYWFNKEIKTASAAQRATRAPKQLQALAPVAKTKSTGKVRTYTTAQASDIYKEAISLCSDTFNAKWKKSGKVTDRMLEHGVRVLSAQAASFLVEKGIIPEEKKQDYTGQLLIPITGTSGQIEGAQIRFLPGTSKLRYLWVSNNEVQSYSNVHGEIPLQYLPSANNVNTALFVEGCLKSIGVYLLLAKKYHVVGGVGAQWGYNKESLREAVILLKAKGVKNFLLAADAGCMLDPHTIRRYEALESELAKYDIKLLTLDWGQMESKESPDVDELKHWDLQAAINVVDVEKADYSALYNRVIKAAKEYKPFKTTNFDVNNPSEEEYLEIVRNNRIIADLRPTGYGKTHNVQNIVEKNPNSHVIYVSQSPRNPTTAFLEDNALIVSSRYRGTVNVDGLSPLGKPKTRTVDKGEEFDNPGTCSRTDAHVSARKKGIASHLICKTCPLKAACESGKDPENNYLYKLKLEESENLANKPLVSVSLKTIGERIFSDKLENIVVIDEFSSLCEPNTLINLDYTEFTALQERIMVCGGMVQLTAPDEKGRRFVYIEGGEGIAEYLEAEDKKSQQEALNRMRYNRETGFVSRYVMLYNALLSGYFYRNKDNKYLINQPNTALQTILEMADKLIILDATLTAAELSARGFADFVTIGADNLATSTQKITVFRAEDFGVFNWGQNKRSMASYEKIRSHFESEGVAFVVPCETRSAGDVGFFSDSRGSNAYQEVKTLVQVGMPLTNVSAVEAQYEVFNNPTFTFQDYYNKRVIDETLQAMGRQRAHRREGEELNYHIVANVQLDALEALGFEVEYKSLYQEISTVRLEIVDSIRAFVVPIANSTIRFQKDLVEFTGRSAQSVSRSFRNMGLKLQEFVKIVSEAQPKGIVWAELSSKATQELLSWDGESPLSEETVFAMEENVFRMGCKGFKMKQWAEVKLKFLLKYKLRMDIFDEVLRTHMEIDGKQWGLERDSGIWYVHHYGLF